MMGTYVAALNLSLEGAMAREEVSLIQKSQEVVNKKRKFELREKEKCEEDERRSWRVVLRSCCVVYIAKKGTIDATDLSLSTILCHFSRLHLAAERK